MTSHTARIAGAACLVLLANLFVASTVHAAEFKAGPRETVRIKRAPKQPEIMQFAALHIELIEAPRIAESVVQSRCTAARIGPRNTIRRCR
jgi:hypothetical protein